jgi:hypothetical protein
MRLKFKEGHRRVQRGTRGASNRTREWISRRWPELACAVFGIAARAGGTAFPLAQLESALAAASLSATLVLLASWGLDADDIRRGCVRASAAALGSAFAGFVGT